jgi:hypothetical protein
MGSQGGERRASMGAAHNREPFSAWRHCFIYTGVKNQTRSYQRILSRRSVLNMSQTSSTTVSTSIAPEASVSFGINLAFSIVALAVIGVLGHKQSLQKNDLWITGIVFLCLVVAGQITWFSVTASMKQTVSASVTPFSPIPPQPLMG